jgi:hypothetical protein
MFRVIAVLASVLALSCLVPSMHAQDLQSKDSSKFIVNLSAAAIIAQGDQVILRGVEIRESGKDVPRYVTLKCRATIDDNGFISLLIEEKEDADGPGIDNSNAFRAGLYVDDGGRRYRLAGPSRSVDDDRMLWSLSLEHSPVGQRIERLSATWITGSASSNPYLNDIRKDQLLPGLCYGRAEGSLQKPGTVGDGPVPAVIGAQQTGDQLTIVFFGPARSETGRKATDGRLTQERTLVLRPKEAADSE